ncbi:MULTISPECIES: tripartite tricarboxylate transporter substrate-binding protein [unclassified Beijerinckia]|uniref:Bug family tripartite tricarboxylate transporter substrate binding protein n=1 Tax=unclassified Beijerinckia TaxID=2638183 RepID=UPI00089C58A6|nr:MULTISPECIES: tripartite tricarboxylate transporter substrate-binding protein [unclassified Beijerinckia]MDH7799132.1 tripartite-type tricarboxylate transporter receptor subunit TctC [Beijerinckia sp. GAS462]SED94065.1 Tripartite-type tricarboxylate transporter, receptor component TctC [Beijerinckia sp. 28-YEA-48]
MVPYECILRAGLFATAILTSLNTGQALADDKGDAFFKGKRMTMLIGSSAGGGYDVYARLITRHLGKHIPGNPIVVASNMAGAGSNVAAAFIANSAPKDGTTIGALYMGAIVEQLFYDKTRPTHNPLEFNYVGNANTDYDVCAVRSDAGINSLSDLFQKEIILGASAPGGATYDFPMLLKELLGAKLKIVSGYPGSREVNLALEKGEVQGICGQSWGGVAAMYEPMIRSGAIKLLAQEAVSGHPYLDSMKIPLTKVFASNDTQRAIMNLFYSQTSFSRPYVVAKDVPASRVTLLRQAFMKTMTDPALVAEAARAQIDIDATPGEVMQKTLAELYDAPADQIQAIRKIYAAK